MKKPNRAIQLSIPTPCHENWNQMTPKEKGRHCASCAKVVTDFSGMTDTQLINFLQSGSGSGCGRFRSDQIGRTLIQKPAPRLWSFPRFLATGILSIFTAIGAAMGQAAVKDSIAIETHMNDSKKEPIPTPQTSQSITGQVTSEGEPIPFANVVLVETKIVSQTDFDGFYSIVIPNRIEIEELILECSSLGFGTKRIINIGDTRVVNVELDSAPMMMGMVGIYTPHFNIRDEEPGEKVYDSSLPSNPR